MLVPEDECGGYALAASLVRVEKAKAPASDDVDIACCHSFACVGAHWQATGKTVGLCAALVPSPLTEGGAADAPGVAVLFQGAEKGRL